VTEPIGEVVGVMGVMGYWGWYWGTGVQTGERLVHPTHFRAPHQGMSLISLGRQVLSKNDSFGL
jgi:hypothetical protein